MSTETYEQFKTKYLAHPDAEEAACDNETPERMEARCRRVWRHYHGGLDAAIARADAEEVEIGEMTKTDPKSPRKEGSAPNKMPAKTKTYLLVVPTYGCPYIHAETPTKKEDRAKMISTLVSGPVERIPFNYYMVHPMFCDPEGSSHHTRWNLVRQLLTSKHVTVYGNENGRYECCPNMALIAKGSLLIEGGQPMPGFGDEVIEVSETVLTALGWKPDDLAYVKVDEDDEEEA